MNEWRNEWINGEKCPPDVVSFEIKLVRSIKKIQLQFVNDFFKVGEITSRKRERKETNIFHNS